MQWSALSVFTELDSCFFQIFSSNNISVSFVIFIHPTSIPPSIPIPNLTFLTSLLHPLTFFQSCTVNFTTHMGIHLKSCLITKYSLCTRMKKLYPYVFFFKKLSQTLFILVHFILVHLAILVKIHYVENFQHDHIPQ